MLGVFEYAHQTFQNDTHLVSESEQIYAEFSDNLRKLYKNEKTMNDFLCGLPELAQNIDPDDIARLILKQETAFTEKRDLYVAFVNIVKAECIMDGAFFNFTSLPDLIVRKGYTRKQYETITKLLVSVKDAYLEQRKQAEEEEEVDEDKKKEPKPENKVITEEDMIEIQLLDDFLTLQ